MSLRPSRPALLALSVLALGLLAAAWCGYWYWSADRLETAIAAWSEQQRERGLELAYRGPQVAGFPFSLSARFEEPQAVSDEGWRWQGPPVEASAPLWNPFLIEALFPGRHRVALEADASRTLQMAEVSAAQARAEVELRGNGRVERAETQLAGVTILPPEESRYAGPFGAEAVAAVFRPLAAGEDGLERYDLRIDLEGVALPAEIKTPLGPGLEEARLEATLNGEIPSGDPKAALTQWREAGGRLEVARISLVWGPLRLTAVGTAALDEQLRPQGAFTAEVSGLLETLNAFVKAGAISFGQAIGIQMGVLALAGQGNEDENRNPVVTVPITLQDGRFYLGPVELFRLYPVL